MIEVRSGTDHPSVVRYCAGAPVTDLLHVRLSILHQIFGIPPCSDISSLAIHPLHDLRSVGRTRRKGVYPLIGPHGWSGPWRQVAFLNDDLLVALGGKGEGQSIRSLVIEVVLSNGGDGELIPMAARVSGSIQTGPVVGKVTSNLALGCG